LQSARHYSFDQSQTSLATSYSQHTPTSQYQAPQPAQYAMAQARSYEVHGLPPESSPAGQQPSQMPVPQQDAHRRASAPVALQPYTQTQFTTAPHPHAYYVTDQKYIPEQKYAPNAHHGY
jgi:hypothetical protein